MQSNQQLFLLDMSHVSEGTDIVLQRLSAKCLELLVQWNFVQNYENTNQLYFAKNAQKH